MTDYISREAALNLIKELHAEAESPEASEALFEAHERIAELQPADVKIVVHAHWVGVPNKSARICSHCACDEPYKFADEYADVYNFCPNCGADMREEKSYAKQ